MPANWIDPTGDGGPARGNNRADNNLQSQLEAMFLEHMEQNIRNDPDYMARERIARQIENRDNMYNRSNIYDPIDTSDPLLRRAEQNVSRERHNREKTVREFERQQREEQEKEIKELRDKAEKTHRNPLNSLEP